jgi:hypothetical protein
MGDAALHLDLFEQPGRKRVFQLPVLGPSIPMVEPENLATTPAQIAEADHPTVGARDYSL